MLFKNYTNAIYYARLSVKSKLEANIKIGHAWYGKLILGEVDITRFPCGKKTHS